MFARCPAQLANETHFLQIMQALRDSTITVLKLERLSFSAKNDVIAGGLAAHLPCSCVTTLSLAYSSMMLDGTLKGDGCLKLAQCFSQSKIKRLDLSACFEPSHADHNTGPMVQNSNARINQVLQELWDGISSDGSCVECLNLNGNAAIRFNKLTAVALMKGLRSGGLKELQLSGDFATTFNDAGKELVHAARDNHLQVLDITQCTGLSKGKSELGKALSNSQLTSLALNGRHGFPQVAIQAMLTALPFSQLQTLKLTECTHLGLQTITLLATACWQSNLRVLELKNCTNLGEDAMLPFARLLPLMQLHTLRLVSVKMGDLTGEAIVAAVSTNPHLRSVLLNKCDAKLGEATANSIKVCATEDELFLSKKMQLCVDSNSKFAKALVKLGFNVAVRVALADAK